MGRAALCSGSSPYLRRWCGLGATSGGGWFAAGEEWVRRLCERLRRADGVRAWCGPPGRDLTTAKAAPAPGMAGDRWDTRRP
ncbi:hypothetical protein GCM10009787_28090 [Streptomyces bangladeshensis]|uniref:Uncharacterized protein n=1 Tax=Streptomyces bangladeshensis TaxID=295352 RepID=A0ABP5NDJ0_9ACTN